MADQGGTFLPGLTKAVEAAAAPEKVTTIDFTTAVTAMLPVFDHLGTVLHFAKAEMVTKNESLIKVAETLPTLEALVDVDKKAGTVATKNSPARNLHRLVNSIKFIQVMLEHLVKDASATLSAACSVAYEESLAPIHTMVVRGTIRAGMMTLPSRAAFIASIGETEETAREHAACLSASSSKLVKAVEALYDEPMPPSTNWFIST